MGARRQRTRTWGAIASIVAVSVLAACGSADDDSSTENGSTPDADTSAVVDVGPGDVEPDKVILASVLLAVGDVDTALAEGLVTADEVDSAVEALADGTLGEWVDRAEGVG